MRDYSNLRPRNEQEAVYKDVVIIGNGPSGLSLSYLLSGRWPHYNGKHHPDMMLQARLQTSGQGRSLVEQDLSFLAQGLEGRSSNPVAVLVDQLMHPGADQGLDYEPVVDWKPHHRPVDHVVIGKGPPGGAWQAMDGNILTLSLSSWMELPGLRYEEWERDNYHQQQHQQHQDTSSIVTSQPPPSHEGPKRVRVAQVAKYYTDYVHRHRLWRYQRRGEVESVKLNEEENADNTSYKGPTWRVEGTDANGRPMNYICRCLVLATGSTDTPNRLNVSGEDSAWVHHDLSDLETALEIIAKRNNNNRTPETDRGDVLIVGAGLSAADAVLAARFHHLRVIHVFRRPSVSMERMLPESMYPEYHKVHQMMSDLGEGYPGYTALAGYSVRCFSGGDDNSTRCATVISPEGKATTLSVVVAGVLIGSRPDLSFLPEEFDFGRKLAVTPGSDVDCRSNPLAVDPWTHRVVAPSPPPGSEPADSRGTGPHLYAVGPVSGDNFVRFIVGGAVAATAGIVANRQSPLPESTNKSW